MMAVPEEKTKTQCVAFLGPVSEHKGNITYCK